MSTKTNIDGHKRCNCKKTNCLKFYCQCFAGGLYCIEECWCNECLNRPAYVNQVMQTRVRIEQRDPLAFSPKIHSIEDEHGKGCKCKKSMCMKDYCGCYKAGVGCSKQCQCVGCENDKGKRGDNSDIMRGEPLVQGT